MNWAQAGQNRTLARPARYSSSPTLRTRSISCPSLADEKPRKRTLGRRSSAIGGTAAVAGGGLVLPLLAISRSLQLGQDLHRPDRKRLRFPRLSFRPGRSNSGCKDHREFRRLCDPALRARAGGGFGPRPVWIVRATVGQVGRRGATGDGRPMRPNKVRSSATSGS